MNGLERCLATVSGSDKDHCFVAPTLSLYGARLTNCPLQQYYTDANAYAEGQLAVVETFAPDGVFSPFNLPAEAEAFGGTVKHHEFHPPTLRTPPATDAESLLRLPLPDLDSSDRLLYVRKAIMSLHKSIGDSTVIGAICLGPMELPALLLGIENWLNALLFEHDDARRILDMIKPFFVSWANALLNDGATMIVLPCAFANPEVITRDILETYSLPALTEVLPQVNGPVIVHHAGAQLQPFIADLASLPGVTGVAIDQRDSYPACREQAGQKVILKGLPGPNLDRYSPDIIEEGYRRIAELADDDPHFGLFTSAADVPLNTPQDNIHAVFKAVRSGS